MTQILVTGGTGVLGKEVVDRLKKAGYTTRIMSRSASTSPQEVEWAQVNMRTGQGLEKPVADVDVIGNCMSDPRKNAHMVDVDGTRKLLEAARAAKVGHVLHLCIVGIERIPYAYYREKVLSENVVKSSGVPWSILRATQFHPFIDLLLSFAPHLASLTVLPTDLKIQPVDAGEVADYLVEYIE